jgi:hypothetical protein
MMAKLIDGFHLQHWTCLEQACTHPTGKVMQFWLQQGHHGCSKMHKCFVNLFCHFLSWKIQEREIKLEWRLTKQQWNKRDKPIAAAIVTCKRVCKRWLLWCPHHGSPCFWACLTKKWFSVASKEWIFSAVLQNSIYQFDIWTRRNEKRDPSLTASWWSCSDTSLHGRCQRTVEKLSKLLLLAIFCESHIVHVQHVQIWIQTRPLYNVN